VLRISRTAAANPPASGLNARRLHGGNRGHADPSIAALGSLLTMQRNGEGPFSSATVLIRRIVAPPDGFEPGV
jgi:hypothetical protein